MKKIILILVIVLLLVGCVVRPTNENLQYDKCVKVDSLPTSELGKYVDTFICGVRQCEVTSKGEIFCWVLEK